MYDYCIMNPPYGMCTNTIHLKFIERCFGIADKQVVIMPMKFITHDNNCYEKYKKQDIWSNSLVNAEEVNSKLFNGTAMDNLAIYSFDNDGSPDITIAFIDGETKCLSKISDYKTSTDYEDEMLSYLLNDHIKDIVIWAGGYGHDNKKRFIKQGFYEDEAERLQDEAIKENCKRIEKLCKKVYLVLSSVTGTTFYSKTSGIIVTSVEELQKHAIKHKFSKGFEIMGFESMKAAENCRTAMSNSLLRFGLSIAHHRLDVIPRKSYRYVPDIDWTDDRVKTDEGLLEVCGCPKDKCKEYADYCKNRIV